MNNRTFRIIVIDDNPDIHLDFIKILNMSKHATTLATLEQDLFNDSDPENSEKDLPEFEINTASQGVEGVAKVKKALEEGNPYALAFVDIRMPPGIDGIETINQIWKYDRDIQTVICTAYSDYSWEDSIKVLGINENLLILKKPFDVTAVRQLATALTKKWLLSKDTKKHTASLNHLVNKQTESLRQSRSLLRATIESSSDGVLIVDLEGKIVDYNRQLVKLLDIPSALLAEKNEPVLLDHIFNLFVYPSKYWDVLTKQLKKSTVSSLQHLKFKNNKIFECYSKPHRVGSKIVGRVWSFHDITEQIQLKEKLEYQATHDLLTGLPNRSLLYDRMAQSISQSIRNNKKFAILFMDLDRFKFINDSLSHEIGDQLLCAIAKRFSKLLRKSDTIARLGGDEFILLCPGIERVEQIETIAQKLIQSFEKYFIVARHRLKITASIGISIYPVDGKTVNALISNADLAMYQAKAQSGNQFVFYTQEINIRSAHQFQLEAELQQALSNHEFRLVYQPEFDLENKKIRSIEVLLRWEHPTKGMIYPIDFISVAESSGLIIPIGEWVMQKACEQVMAWHKEGLPLIKIAVNVATKQLRQPRFATMVEKILKHCQLAPEYLEIEITENVIIDKEIQQTVMKLKQLGCNIILDDFGTGNSTLNSLKALQIDRLKIDQSFIRNINKSRGDEAIIESIIAICHSMNFKVVAEGVEYKNQIDFLKKKHCDEIQGFLWSKPLSAEQLVEFLNGPGVPDFPP